MEPNSEYFNALEMAHVAAFIKTAEGLYLAINEAGATILNRPIAQIIGASDYDLYDETSAEFLQARDLAILTSGKAQMFEAIVQTKERWKRFLSAKAASRGHLHGQSLLVGLSADITLARSPQAEDSVQNGFSFLQADPTNFLLQFWTWSKSQSAHDVIALPAPRNVFSAPLSLLG